MGTEPPRRARRCAPAGRRDRARPGPRLPGPRFARRRHRRCRLRPWAVPGEPNFIWDRRRLLSRGGAPGSGRGSPPRPVHPSASPAGRGSPGGARHGGGPEPSGASRERGRRGGTGGKQSPWRRAAWESPWGKGLGESPWPYFPRKQAPDQPALRGGCEQDWEAAVQPRSHRARRSGPSAGCPRGLRSLSEPRRVLAGLCREGGAAPAALPGSGVHSSVFEEIEKRNKTKPNQKNPNKQKNPPKPKKKNQTQNPPKNKQTKNPPEIRILNRFKTSSALSQRDGQFYPLFTKCSLSSSLERVDHAK